MEIIQRSVKETYAQTKAIQMEIKVVCDGNIEKGKKLVRFPLIVKGKKLIRAITFICRISSLCTIFFFLSKKDSVF